MRQRPPLSPAQTSSFAMGRVLLLLESWQQHSDAALEFERGALLDFALQHPKLVAALLPGLVTALEAHGLEDSGLDELFASRHFTDARQAYATAVAGLTARGLTQRVIRDTGAGGEAIRLSETGAQAATNLSTPLSLAMRAVAVELARVWHRKNLDALRVSLREAIPDESLAVARLTVPFGAWLHDAEVGTD